MDKVKLAEKLYLAYCRGSGIAKATPFTALGSDIKTGWTHAAEIADANLAVSVEHDADGIHVKRGDEVVWEWSPGPLANAVQPEEESDDIPEEALLDVLADVDDAIACAITASNFEALRWLIGYKAQLLGVA